MEKEADALKDSVINKFQGDENTAKSGMTSELHAYFGAGFDININVSLDKYWNDFDVKDFVRINMKIDSWDSLSEADKKACFLYIGEKRELPTDFAGLVQEAF
eukprot:scaffold77192_cov37-Cyclotella_meneghiniana.AAC.7